jgi:hypothetical protein
MVEGLVRNDTRIDQINKVKEVNMVVQSKISQATDRKVNNPHFWEENSLTKGHWKKLGVPSDPFGGIWEIELAGSISMRLSVAKPGMKGKRGFGDGPYLAAGFFTKGYVIEKSPP